MEADVKTCYVMQYIPNMHIVYETNINIVDDFEHSEIIRQRRFISEEIVKLIINEFRKMCRLTMIPLWVILLEYGGVH